MDESKASLEREYNRKKNQKRALENERKILCEQKDRLSDAYDAIKRAKDDMRDITRRVKRTVGDSYSWKGQNYDDILKGEGATLGASCDTAVRNIDRALDAINLERDAIAGKIYDKDLLIGGLERAMHSLWTRIQNWIN